MESLSSLLSRCGGYNLLNCIVKLYTLALFYCETVINSQDVSMQLQKIRCVCVCRGAIIANNNVKCHFELVLQPLICCSSIQPDERYRFGRKRVFH